MGQKQACIFFHGTSHRSQNPIAMGSLLFCECPFIRRVIGKEAIIEGLSLLFGCPCMLLPKGSLYLMQLT
jgi:hypothetical protein